MAAFYRRNPLSLRLFLAQEEHRRALAFIGAPGLRRLALENPLMPDFVPPADPRLWLEP
jgi:hypothetical protein